MNRKVLVVVGAILLSLASCCGLCLVTGLVDADGGGARYECKLSGTAYTNGTVQPTYTPSGSFTLEGDTFTTAAGSGSVKRTGDVVSFSGSDMDGWQGTVGEGGTMYFSQDPRVRHAGGRVSVGEVWCEPR